MGQSLRGLLFPGGNPGADARACQAFRDYNIDLIDSIFCTGGGSRQKWWNIVKILWNLNKSEDLGIGYFQAYLLLGLKYEQMGTLDEG